MSTIPASQYVDVIPNVLSAGGNALQMLGLCVDQNIRVPIGTVASFPSAASVAAFFGSSSKEASLASVYFAGFNGRTAIPSAMLFAQWPGSGVPAYLQSGDVAALGLPAIKALSGSLTVVMDGYTYTNASFSLSSASSFSAAAGEIQTALNTSLPSAASATGIIAPETAVMTASIDGNMMYVTAVGSGLVVPGALISSGAAAGTTVQSQLSGTPNGIGTYAVSISQIVATTTLDFTYGLLTISGGVTGSFTPGQTLSGASVTANTLLTGYGPSTTGGDGTYYVNLTQTVGSTTISASGTGLVVTFDSVSGSFFITSGQSGSTSTAAFATGTLAASLLLTQATGAVLSQGSAAQLPGAFMNGVVNQTQNWATFFTSFDPDGGTGGGNTQKQLFAAWVNGTQNRYAYVCWDTDITPTQSTNAASSLGQILKANNSSGTILVWESGDQFIAAFISGMAASVNYEVENGQVTYFGKSQTGLVAAVTSQLVAANLTANGYSFYGASATANQAFVFLNNGFVTGPFLWANTFVNQIWLNNQLQLALMELITQLNSVPYNAAGNAQIETACLGVISAALLAGVIIPGVQLSPTEILAINAVAGPNASGTVQTQGWYLLIQPATPQVRQARTSPPITFWYTDGGALQQVTVNSVDVQ